MGQVWYFCELLSINIAQNWFDLTTYTVFILDTDGFLCVFESLCVLIRLEHIRKTADHK